MSRLVCPWKNAQGMFLAVPWAWLWPLSDSTMAFYVYIRQKDDDQFRDITYTRSITESKIFLKRSNFYFTGYDTYQSKTCVEHIEQVIDKSLIILLIPLWIYYLFFCIWGLYVVNIIKSMWESQIKKLLTFWSNLWISEV